MIDRSVPSDTMNSSPAWLSTMRERIAVGMRRFRSWTRDLRCDTPHVRIPALPRVGLLGGAGLALITASVVSWFSVLGPMRRDVADLRADVVAAEARARGTGRAPTSLAAQAMAFVLRLPTRDELPAVLKTVVAQAAAAGLRLDRGDYEFTMAKSGVIARYRLTLPVVGTYVQVQKFVEGTLAALPPVALEGLKLERDSVGDKDLRASLQFVVMVRGES